MVLFDSRKNQCRHRPQTSRHVCNFSPACPPGSGTTSPPISPRPLSSLHSAPAIPSAHSIHRSLLSSGPGTPAPGIDFLSPFSPIPLSHSSIRSYPQGLEHLRQVLIFFP